MVSGESGECPLCQQRVGLTAARGRLRTHLWEGAPCLASGGLPRKAPGKARLVAWRRKLSFFIFTVLAGGLGILSYFGLTPSSSSSPFTREPGAIAADPYSFVSFNGFSPKSQECLGLLGLCIDEKIDHAFASLGRQERQGWPIADSQSNTSHSWQLDDIGTVDLQESSGKIAQIRIFFIGARRLQLALPEHLILRSPSSLLDAQLAIDDAMDRGPFSTSVDWNEGEYVVAAEWNYLYLPMAGTPSAQIEIIGFEENVHENPQMPASHCDFEQYEKWARETQLASIAIIKHGTQPLNDICPGRA